MMRLPPGFPLAWPEDWTRTPPERRKASAYRVTASKAQEELVSDLRALGASQLSVTTDVPLRLDGKPLLSARPPKDPGVAVWWYDRRAVELAQKRGELPAQRVIACDQWLSLRENLRACGLAISALRQLERSKATQILDRAQAAFDVARALEVGRPWWALVLDVDPHALTAELVARAFKRQALTRHPDQGGTVEGWHELERARDEALRHV
jgi:hypothetical protein